MRGRLTLRIDEISFFFSTYCELEIADGKASISFEERGQHGKDRTTIGLKSSKVFIIRKSIFEDSGEEESVYVISDESLRTRRVAVDINGYTALLFAANMKIDIDESEVKAEIRCVLSVDDKNPQEYLLKLACFAID